MKCSQFDNKKSETFLTLGVLLLVTVLLFSGCAAIKSISSGAKHVSAASKSAKVLKPIGSSAQTIPKMQGLKNNIAPPVNLTDDAKNEVPILMNIPSNSDEFKNIHNILPTQSQMSSVNKVRNKFYTNDNNVRKLDDLQNLMGEIEDAQSQYVIIVGHNDEGRFIFVNGDSIEIAELQNTISNYNKIPIFLSCKSQKYSNSIIGVSNDITYDEAYETAKKMSVYLRKNSTNWKNPSKEEIVEKLKDLNFDYKLNVKIRNKAIIITFAAVSTTEYSRNRKKSRR